MLLLKFIALCCIVSGSLAAKTPTGSSSRPPNHGSAVHHEQKTRTGRLGGFDNVDQSDLRGAPIPDFDKEPINWKDMSAAEIILKFNKLVVAPKRKLKRIHESTHLLSNQSKCQQEKKD